AWTLHTTDHQVAGRGRLDRSFEMPDQAGVAVSVLLRPAADRDLTWTWLPLIVGIATCEAFETFGVESVLKWPNDVLTPKQRKLAGILAERVETPEGPAAVIGVGANVSLTLQELPTPSATSLLLENATTTDRHQIVATLAAAIRRWTELWESGENAMIEQAYRARCSTIGQEVRIVRAGLDDVTGVAEGIDSFGCLIVDGQPWSAGDVVHVRPVASN
ncbi:MAG: biotin--[acetyl-CoA-carboxylase] ligase, partial [Actinomycetales bacterium]|nr:biotin--[acetyl-CoA-carboxylase] ligase [Actinomycetales bacterium]